MNLIQKSRDLWCSLEERFLPEELKGRDTLSTWKERALSLTFLCVASFGFVALVPSLILAYQRQLMVIFFFDIIAYAVLLMIFLVTKIPLKVKALTSLGLLYALGIVLLVYAGYYGAGLIWILGASTFAIVFFDNKYAIVVFLFNLLIMLSIGAYILFGHPIWHYLLENPTEIWVILTVNFMAVNALMILVIVQVKSNIDRAVGRQVKTQTSLVKEMEFSDYIIKSTPGLFFLFEIQDNLPLLKRWNENYSSILGYTDEELKDMDSTHFFKEEDYPYVQRMRSRLLEKGSVSYEIDVLRKDGTSFPGYIQMYSFRKNNQIYAIGTGMDISNQKKEAKEKENLQKSLAISQKTSALGTLSSGIAHDFNNILSGIRGYAELMRMAPDDIENVNKGVDQILKGSERAGELVRQILTFSRESKTQKKAMKPYLIVKEAVKFMRSSIPATIEIKEKIESRKSINADATQMHQLVMNLCTNAYHAMKNTGGILIVELSEVQISSKNYFNNHKFIPGEYLLLKIADTGYGMNKRTMARIFEPYFTTKEAGEGTGLGLAVVQGIIKEHSGHIQVSSEINKGTVFELYFPVIDPAKQSREPEKASKEPEITRNAERILMVDDETSIRVSVQSIFEDYGYHVETYPNGELALQRFLENPDYFDLVITDVAMPKMSGDRLIKEIFQIREDIPVIVQTGYAEAFDKATAYQAGVKKYLQKPTEINVLLLAVQGLLRPDKQ